MDLGDRLQRWWDRMLGYEPPTARSANRAAGKAAGPSAARPISTVKGSDGEATLRLSVSNEPTQEPHEPRHGEAGFDPYSSNGKYRKPRGWNDVQRT